MNPSDLLNQIRDIHTPADISWWPLALGWWLSALVVLVGIAFGFMFIRRWYCRNKWRRSALQEYRTLKSSLLSGETSAATPVNNKVAEINALLKRCISAKTGSSHYLSLSQKEWADALKNGTAKPTLEAQDIDKLCFKIYQTTPIKLDQQSLNRIEAWIRGL